MSKSTIFFGALFLYGLTSHAFLPIRDTSPCEGALLTYDEASNSLDSCDCGAACACDGQHNCGQKEHDQKAHADSSDKNKLPLQHQSE